MHDTLLFDLALRIREFMFRSLAAPPGAEPGRELSEEFNRLALELHALQLTHNAAYHALCLTRGSLTAKPDHWSALHGVPTSAFKELAMTCLPSEQRTRVFRSSGTTGQSASLHYHCPESLALYEVSLSTWFRLHGTDSDEPLDQSSKAHFGRLRAGSSTFVILTPPASQTPHSSLTHMFEVVSKAYGSAGTCWGGRLETDGSWGLDMEHLERTLAEAVAQRRPVSLLGTAFNYVHFLEQCAARGHRFELPTGSRLLETGGYKGRSRSMPKHELHNRLSELLGIPHAAIVCEYGMSELSSQAYDTTPNQLERGRVFHFPPWARVQVISPETGREVPEGETGLLRIWDLANVWSVLAIQTEDMAVRRGHGFELVGRAVQAEPRGCSLMAR